ncbi:MAG: PGPGW domain-containing protein [Planctomycetota bacterium]
MSTTPSREPGLLDRGVLWRAVRKVVIVIAGTLVVMIGAVLLFFPGPGLLVILAGLAILATEFVWAARVLHGVKRRARNAVQKMRNAANGKVTPPPT